ncbi:MAG TPA: hypothetical protein PLL78_04735 [Fimbriimonadaceae bacterium]|nr:hypothetical protein [Fimbriimonadaceae bacterium]
MKAKAVLLGTGLALAACAYQQLDARTRALQTETLSNSKMLAIGMLIYCGDYDDLYPYVQDTKAAFVVTYPYMKNLEVTKTHNPNGGSFLFNRKIGGVKSTKVHPPEQIPMYYETNFWPDDRRIVAYADAHAVPVTKAGWPKIETALKKTFPRIAKKPLPPGDKLAKEFGVKF